MPQLPRRLVRIVPSRATKIKSVEIHEVEGTLMQCARQLEGVLNKFPDKRILMVDRPTLDAVRRMLVISAKCTDNMLTELERGGLAE